MDASEEEGKMNMYTISSVVKALEHKRKALRAIANRTDPHNPVVNYEYEDIGWFVTFENSHESLFVGMEEPPDLKPGTRVLIQIRPT